MIKVAYFCEPQVGGTFSFFRRMRPLLLERGIDFRCIPPVPREQLVGSVWENMDGMNAVAFPAADLPAASALLIRHLEQEGYGAVMVLPGTDILTANLVCYLPRSVRAVARVPMITRGAYAPTRAIIQHLNMICAVSHRVRDDLVRRYGVQEQQIEVIYNGVDIPSLQGSRSDDNGQRPFRLVYSGRLWDVDKGVMLLPAILEKVRRKGLDAELAIAGSGPDHEQLSQEFQRRALGQHVEFLGDISLEQVGQHLASADCFVLPSRFEGCPNALMEAMAHGCPCVAARIRGSVDRIIEHGESGFLAEVASPDSFSEYIFALAFDMELRNRVGEAARARIQSTFSAECTADSYAAMLRRVVMEQVDHREPPRSLDQYRVPDKMLPTWRTRIPVPIKNAIRKWMERLGMSS